MATESAIPKNWLVVPLSDVLELNEAGVWGNAPLNDGTDYPVLRSTNIQNGELVLDDVAYRSFQKDVEKYVLTDGDLLITKSSGSPHLIGKNILFKRPNDQKTYLFSNFTQRLRAKESLLDPYYLFYYLNSAFARKFLEGMQSTTSGLRNLDMKLYVSQKLPLPPPLEQQRIVTILKQADDLRRLRRAANEKAQGLIQALFYEMFGDPIANPMGWERARLERLTIRITKGESPRWQGFEYTDEGPLFITSENVLWGSLDLAETRRIPPQFHRKLERSKLHSGDVLVNLVGASIGRTCIVPDNIGEANVNQAVGVISPNEDLNSDFLNALLLTHEMQEQLQGQKVEVARANISLVDLRKLEVPKPPLSKQLDFSQHVSEIHRVRRSQSTAHQKLETLFDSLLAQAFAGELTERWTEQHRAELVRQAEEMRAQLAHRRAPADVDAIMLGDDGQVTLVEFKVTGAPYQLVDSIRYLTINPEFPRYWTLLDVANALRMNKIPRAALREAVDMLVVRGDVRPTAIPYDASDGTSKVIQAYTRVAETDLVGADEIRL